MYSSISPDTGEPFSLILPEVNTEMMNIYLSEISKKYSQKKNIIIMDCTGWHKAKKLAIPSNIEIIFYLRIRLNLIQSIDFENG